MPVDMLVGMQSSCSHIFTLQCRHMERHGVRNRRSALNCVFKLRSKTSKAPHYLPFKRGIHCQTTDISPGNVDIVVIFIIFIVIIVIIIPIAVVGVVVVVVVVAASCRCHHYHYHHYHHHHYYYCYHHNCYCYAFPFQSTMIIHNVTMQPHVIIILIVVVVSSVVGALYKFHKFLVFCCRFQKRHVNHGQHEDVNAWCFCKNTNSSPKPWNVQHIPWNIYTVCALLCLAIACSPPVVVSFRVYSRDWGPSYYTDTSNTLYRQTANINCAKPQNLNVSRLVLQLSLPNQLKSSRVSSGEWRCCWSSAARRCSNYIWVINNILPTINGLVVSD